MLSTLFCSRTKWALTTSIDLAPITKIMMLMQSSQICTSAFAVGIWRFATQFLMLLNQKAIQLVAPVVSCCSLPSTCRACAAHKCFRTMCEKLTWLTACWICLLCCHCWLIRLWCAPADLKDQRVALTSMNVSVALTTALQMLLASTLKVCVSAK